jgi:hypothetical protein
MTFCRIISNIELSLAKDFYDNDISFTISYSLLGPKLSDIVNDLTYMNRYQYDE